MSFTYSLSTDIGKIRLQLGDTTSGVGVKPDGTNLTDEEIQALLTAEGDSVMRATAAACEVLARFWGSVANIAVGPRREDLGRIAERWAQQAKELRAQYGGGATTFSAGWTRTDGYSENADTVESEYLGKIVYIRT